MTKYLKGECVHCGGRIEFPVEAAGMTTGCPHCGKQTELLLAQPKDQPTIPPRIIIWTLVAVVLLIGGFAATLVALKRAQRWAEGQRKAAVMAQVSNTPPPKPLPPPQDDAISKAEFRISEVKLDKKAGSSLIYAVGTLENVAARTRYGVKLQFDVLDADGKKIGAASDYQATIDPNGKWSFRALVVETKAAGVKATGVTEQQ